MSIDGPDHAPSFFRLGRAMAAEKVQRSLIRNRDCNRHAPVSVRKDPPSLMT
jgi:hypothetical protein